MAPQVDTAPAAVGLLIVIMFAVLMAIAVFMLVVLIVFRNHKILKASQVRPTSPMKPPMKPPRAASET